MKDLVPYAPHQQRVVDEKVELDEKLVKLIGFFSTPIYAGLDKAEQSRLQTQAHHMRGYSQVLGERISHF